MMSEHRRRSLAVTLLLLSFGSLAAGADQVPRQIDVCTSGTEGYHTYRIPGIVLSSEGTLLAFYEGRKTSSCDHGDIDLVLRRSTDDGKTWAKPTELTQHVKNPDWGWFATGPGHGIQLSSGRLAIPCDFYDEKGWREWAKHQRSMIFYSDDHGQSWQRGGVTEPGMGEAEVVELADRSLLMSMRQVLVRNQRAFATSGDGGLTWSKPVHNPQVYSPNCQASIERYTLQPQAAKNRILYSGPGGPIRSNLTIRLSYDEGKTWPVAKVLYGGSTAYSDLVVLPDGTIGCLYERDNYGKITFARFTLQWLTDGQDRLVEE